MNAEHRNNSNTFACKYLTNDILLDYGEKALDSEPAGRVAAHLSACMACRKRAEGLNVLVKGMRTSPALQQRVEIPASIDKMVWDGVRELAGRKPPQTAAAGRWPLWIAAAAACVLAALGLGFFISRSLKLYEGKAPTREEQLHAQLDQKAKENAELRSRLSQALWDKDAQQNLATALEDEAGRLSAKVEELESAATELRSDLEREKKTSARLKGDVAEAREQVVGLREEMESLQKHFDNSVEELAVRSAALDKAEAEMTDVKERLETLEVAVGELKLENERLRAVQLVRGDVNGDGKADMADVTLLCSMILAGKDIVYEKGLDANNDGKIDVADVLCISNTIVGR